MTAARLAARAGPALRRRRLALVVAWAASFLAVLLALLALTDRPPGTRVIELAVNGGFESGLVPWQPYGEGRLELVRPGRTGAASGAAVAQKRDHYGFVWPDAAADSAAGDRYTVTAWVRGGGGAVGDRVYLILVERVPETARTIAGSHFTLDREWRRARVSGIARGPHGDIDLYVFVDRAHGAGDTVYLDDVALAHRRASPSGRAR